MFLKIILGELHSTTVLKLHLKPASGCVHYNTVPDSHHKESKAITAGKNFEDSDLMNHSHDNVFLFKSFAFVAHFSTVWMGMGTVFLAFLLGRYLGGEKTGLIAALFLQATFIFHPTLSRNGRRFFNQRSYWYWPAWQQSLWRFRGHFSLLLWDIHRGDLSFRHLSENLFPFCSAFFQWIKTGIGRERHSSLFSRRNCSRRSICSL